MYGRDGELAKLNQVRNDPKQRMSVRKTADRNFTKIVDQLQDKKLMSLRTRLIHAAQAGDVEEQAKIAAAMRDHLGEDRETGNYDAR